MVAQSNFYQMLSMKIKLLDITSVHPYDRNPRINDSAVDAVAASLREFGFRQPIVVDTDNIIIVGHVRYKAAVKMGLQKIPVHVATDLTPEQVKAYRIADNKTNELSDWDFSLLEKELEMIGDIFTGFEESPMFDEVKLNDYIDTMESIDGIPPVVVEVPEIPSVAVEIPEIPSVVVDIPEISVVAPDIPPVMVDISPMAIESPEIPKVVMEAPEMPP